MCGVSLPFVRKPFYLSAPILSPRTDDCSRVLALRITDKALLILWDRTRAVDGLADTYESVWAEISIARDCMRSDEV